MFSIGGHTGPRPTEGWVGQARRVDWLGHVGQVGSVGQVGWLFHWVENLSQAARGISRKLLHADLLWEWGVVGCLGRLLTPHVEAAGMALERG